MKKLFTDEQEIEICEKYESGLSATKISENYNCSANTICNVLKRNDIQTRKHSDVLKKFTLEQELQICKDYALGLSTRKVGEKWGCNESSVPLILQRNGYKTRSRLEVVRKFTDKQELEICQKYEEGLDGIKLSNEYGCDDSTIYEILKRNDVKIRRKGRTLSKEHKQKISKSNIGKHSFYGPDNPRWRGGVSFEPYCHLFNDEFKERVREFFNRKCVISGVEESDESWRLSVHHVTYNKKMCCDGAHPLLVPVTRSWNTKLNLNRKYWEEVLTNYIMIWYDGQCFLPKEA